MCDLRSALDLRAELVVLDVLRALVAQLDALLHDVEPLAREHIDEWDIDDNDRAAAHAQFRDAWYWAEGEDDQRRIVRDFTYTDTDDIVHEFSDSWEWEAQDWDHHFLLALYAIVFSVRTYREYEAAIAAAREVAA